MQVTEERLDRNDKKAYHQLRLISIQKNVEQHIPTIWNKRELDVIVSLQDGKSVRSHRPMLRANCSPLCL